MMYSNAQWIDVNNEHVMLRVDINGLTSYVPLDPANTDYQNIMKLAEDGELTIADVEEVTTE